MSKNREESTNYYLYIDGQAVPVSEQVYRVYQHYERKEEYFSYDLKTEKFQKDTAIFLPSREDSYERLLEKDKQFAASGQPVEKQAVSSVWLEELLQHLSSDERIMYDHLEEFQLLLKCSKGSRVENFIEEITNQYAKQNSEFVKAAYEAGYTKYLPSDIEIHILTHGYITALCECILHDVPYEKAEDYVKNIIKFQHYGWYGVLGLPFK